MNEVTIESFGYFIKIQSDINIQKVFNDSLVIRNFIPGLNIFFSQKKYHFLIEHRQSKNIRTYNEVHGKIIVYDDWGYGIPIYIIHLLYKFFSKAYLQNNTISLHSSAIEKNGILYLLVGFSGAGKTSLLIKLLEDYNFKMLSGNKILLKFVNDKIVIAGATDVLSIRNESPTRLKKIKPICSEEFSNRTVFVLPAKYFSSKTKYKKIYFVSVKINAGVKEFYEMDSGDVLPILYPMSLDLVNREIIMFGGSFLVPDNVSMKIKRNIFKILNRYKNNSLFYHASGNLNYICKKINKM